MLKCLDTIINYKSALNLIQKYINNQNWFVIGV